MKLVGTGKRTGTGQRGIEGDRVAKRDREERDGRGWCRTVWNESERDREG